MNPRQHCQHLNIDHFYTVNGAETSAALSFFASKMTTATLFLHQGPASHLLVALAQTRVSDPNGRIILFGDHVLPPGFNFVEVVSPGRFLASSNQLAEFYWHFSVNHPHVELICLQRWFVMRDAWSHLGLESAVHYDSDVLPFCSADEMYQAYQGVDVAMVEGISLNCAVFYSRLFLDILCEEIWNFYTGVKSPVTEEIWGYIRKGKVPSAQFSLCDMTFIGAVLNHRKELKVSDLSAVRDGVCCDHNINAPQPGVEMLNGIKKITWKDGRPYATLARDGSTVRMRNLHFQGQAKALMQEYFDKGCESLRAGQALQARPIHPS